MLKGINNMLRKRFNMVNLPKSNTLAWKIIVYIAIGIIIFASLHATRIAFTNSMVFVVLSIILTILLIYFLERYVFPSKKAKDDMLQILNNLKKRTKV